jgi:putative aminopeptidase FrvX
MSRRNKRKKKYSSYKPIKTKTMGSAWYNNRYETPKVKKRDKIDLSDFFSNGQFTMEMFHKDLLDVLSVQSYSGIQQDMVKYIASYIKNYDIMCDIYRDDGNLYITKGNVLEGEVYPCVVAHMDTVHQIVKGYKVYNQNDIYFAWAGRSQKGTGGDDKVGVFIALSMLRFVNNIKVVFFRDEEIGMLGSKNAEMTFFENVGYVIQCDRKGNDEVIIKGAGTDLCSSKFLDTISSAMTKYVYKKASGSVTDVVQLKNNGIECSVVNIACGYFDPHTSKEIVVGNDVVYTWSLVRSMIALLGNKFYEHKKPVYRYTQSPQQALWKPTSYLDKEDIIKIEKDEFQEEIITFKEKECKVCKNDKFYIDFGEITCSRCYNPTNTSINDYRDDFYD